MNSILFSTFLLSLAFTPAWADQCPSLIHQAQEELNAMAKMHSTMIKDANDYIEKTQAAHDAGKHMTQ
jgi:Na+/phosphate symporter